MASLTETNELITSDKQLTEIFYSGIKQTHKIGVEFEKIPIAKQTFKAPGFWNKNGIYSFLNKYKNKENLIPIKENSITIGLSGNMGDITLEPGCQIEFSTKPMDTISDIISTLENYNKETNILAKECDITFLGLGIQPLSTFNDIKIIPKKRYEFMTKYLIKQASMPYVMMRETAGIQVSIDYSSEFDAIQKLLCALKLSPFMCAMFSNSPIRQGKLTGYKSFRANSWLHTDFQRCGLISKRLFEDNDFSFKDYTEILLDLPMIFKKNEYMGNTTFREHLRTMHSLDISDWETHLSLFFPDVRLKSYLEIRNHDCQKKELIPSIPAIYKGIMYSKNGVEKVNELFKDLKYYDFELLRHNVPRLGIDFKINNISMQNYAKEIISIAREGLTEQIPEEADYLLPIEELINNNLTPADIIIKNFQGSWNKNLSKLVEFSTI